jgi:acetolactate synthase-1/2/3 large subunit
MTRMRVADYIALRCSEAGSKDVFLVTGGGAMHLNDAFNRTKSLKVTCFHHEQAAAMAAEAYYRYSNRIAILNVTSGPGGINALNGVYGAYVDSIAMVIISGQVKTETYIGTYELPLRQLGDQEVNIVEVVKPLVKYATVLSNPLDVRAVIDKAFYLATAGRPGPTWIDVPLDIQSTVVEPEQLIPWDKRLDLLVTDPWVTKSTKAEILYHLNPSNLKEASAHIAKQLISSRRPVIMLGTGVRLASQQQSILNTAAKYNVPIVTGWNAHDLLPNEHRSFAGRPGTVGDRAGNFAVQNADLLIVLGCRLNIRQISYNYKNFAHKAWKAIVDIDPTELIKPTIEPNYRVCADLRDFVPHFISALLKFEPNPVHEDYLNWCQARVRHYPVVLPDYRSQLCPINPYAFLEQLFKKLPDDAAVVTGNGSACVMTFQVAVIKAGQRLFTNSGSASMGYDLPAAIGVALARNNKPVYCIAGDGSLMMNVQELQTVIGNKLPVKIIVLNNNGYVSIKQTQSAYFPDNEFGTTPLNGLTLPDFKRLATAFGIKAHTLTWIDQLECESIQQCLFDNDPLLLDVQVDPNQQFSPKLMSRKLDDGTMISPSLDNMAPFLAPEELLENTIDD